LIVKLYEQEVKRYEKIVPGSLDKYSVAWKINYTIFCILNKVPGVKKKIKYIEFSE